MAKSPKSPLPEFHEFLIDGILPANEVHLIGGASGTGKSRFLLQHVLAPFIHREPVLGHEVHPVPYAYVSLDRSYPSLLRTLESLDLLGQIDNIVTMDALGNEELNVPTIVKKTLELYPTTKFLIIEGFQLIGGDDSRAGYNKIGKALRQATMLCNKHKITILGVCHSPKLKENESFQNEREYILGSTGWASYSDTIIYLARNKKTATITIHVMPRNAKAEAYDARFVEGGKLVFVAGENKSELLTAHLVSFAKGDTTTRADLLTWAKETLDVGKTVVDDVLKTLTTCGVLERSESIQGLYLRTDRPHLTIAHSLNGDIQVEI
jgi:AAA domain-containing protein